MLCLGLSTQLCVQGATQQTEHAIVDRFTAALDTLIAKKNPKASEWDELVRALRRACRGCKCEALAALAETASGLASQEQKSLQLEALRKAMSAMANAKSEAPNLAELCATLEAAWVSHPKEGLLEDSLMEPLNETQAVMLEQCLKLLEDGGKEKLELLPQMTALAKRMVTERGVMQSSGCKVSLCCWGSKGIRLGVIELES